MSRSSAGMLDFDDEARLLFKKLNLDPDARSGGKWNPIDPIYRHPTGGGTIYVGNQTAAENIQLLKQHGITHVVNCTHGESRIPNFHEGQLKYFAFKVSHWQNFLNNSHDSVAAFVDPLFSFVDEAVTDGGSVLIHCLAGAHRAGTTGCACLIHYVKLDVPTAIVTAKRCRSIIDPIGHLPEFLKRLKAAEDAKKVRQST
jgi:hypothetical protein